MLALLIRRAKADGQIRGVIPHLVDDGLSILQYADDTVLFLDHDLEQAKNLKLLLCAFEQLSGLKINFHKSEIFFAMVQQKRWRISIPSSLAVTRGNIHLLTSEYQCIVDNSLIHNGVKWKNGFKRNSLVGKLSTCHTEDV
jgi:hypothetical protein